jgi:hypothetical protein
LDVLLPDCAREARARGGVREQALAENKAQVQANKKFSTPEMIIAATNVVAIVSSSPF